MKKLRPLDPEANQNNVNKKSKWHEPRALDMPLFGHGVMSMAKVKKET